MDETVQLLQDVVRNARTGRDSVEHLMKKAGDGPMREELEREKASYLQTQREGERALADAGGRTEPTGALARAGMWMGLEMETLADRSDAHIAEMVIQGATMGVIEMTKSLNTCADAAPHARGLATQFVERQNEIVDRQKGFLRN